MSDFFRTRMGQRFYEATMPKLADQLERLNANIEALVAALREQRCVRDDKARLSGRPTGRDEQEDAPHPQPRPQE